MDSATLKNYVNAQDDDDAFVATCLAESIELVDRLIGTNVVPSAIKDRAYLETGADLFNRKNAPNGISQFADFGGEAIRINRDPLVQARALLKGFLRAPIA